MDGRPEKFLEQILEGNFSEEQYRELCKQALSDPNAAEILADVRFLIDIDKFKSQANRQAATRVERQAGYLSAMVDSLELQNAEAAEAIVEVQDSEEVDAGLWESVSEGFWSWILIRFNMFPVPPDFFERKTEKIKINFLAPFKPAMIVAIVLFLSFYFLNKDGGVQTDKKTVKIPTYTRSENQASLIELSDAVQLVMAGKSTFKRHSETRIELQKGSLWLDVEKNGAGFEVDTEFGLVRVAGTSFGVSKIQNEVIIEVSEGTVLFIRGEKITEIGAGKYLAAELESISDVADRDNGENIPFWVKNAQEQHWIDNIPTLIAHWDMEPEQQDGTKALVRDRGPHGLHGTPLGNTVGPSFESNSNSAELFGRAAQFSSEQFDRIELGEQEVLTSLSNNFTVMAWVKRNNARDSYDRILGSGWRSWGFGFHEELLSMRIIPYGIDEEGYADDHRLEVPRDIGDQWVHVACTFKDVNLEMFLDGNSIGTKKIEGFSAADRNPDPYWTIGATLRKDTEIRSQFDGSIDEVRVYSEILDAATIRRISKIDLLEDLKAHNLEKGETPQAEDKQQ